MINEIRTEEWMTIDAYAKRYRLLRGEVLDLINSGKLPSKIIEAPGYRGIVYIVNAAATVIAMPGEFAPESLVGV